MTEGGSRGRTKSAEPAPAPEELLLDSPLGGASDLPLPLEIPPAMFTGPGLLQLADLLPVMTAFLPFNSWSLCCTDAADGRVASPGNQRTTKSNP